MQLVQAVEARLVPVGRLDWDAEGALLLTDDTGLAHELLHPSRHIPKSYLVKVRGIPGAEVLEELARGVYLEDGKTAPAGVELARTTENHAWIRLTIYEGRNQQVKRMFAAVGHPVLKLKRDRFAGLSVDDLPPAGWRHLTEAEVAALRKLAATTRPEPKAANPREAAAPVRREKPEAQWRRERPQGEAPRPKPRDFRDRERAPAARRERPAFDRGERRPRSRDEGRDERPRRWSSRPRSDERGPPPRRFVEPGSRDRRELGPPSRDDRRPPRRFDEKGPRDRAEFGPPRAEDRRPPRRFDKRGAGDRRESGPPRGGDRKPPRRSDDRGPADRRPRPGSAPPRRRRS
jgi:23S rRNA pseudouridine2605 synthase